MTTAAQDVYTTLQALLNGRLYPGVAPSNAAFPYAVYQLVSGVPEQHFGGEAGLTNYRYQVDVFHPQKSAVDALALSIRAAMNSATLFRSTCAMHLDDYEPEAKLHRVTLDFSIWRA